MTTIVRSTAFSLLLLTLLLVTGCNMGNDQSELKGQVVAHYADLVYANYQDAYDGAVALQAAIDAFIANPTAETHEAAKTAWLAAREPYGQTEAFRFYGGPIDDEDGPEGLINAWPMDEQLVDYVEGAPEAGIINDPSTYPEITPDLLLSLNQAESEESVTTGYHAIEFLLWGQDLSADGAGQRSFEDYVAGGTAPNPERRAAYLQAAAQLLVQHLGEVTAEWDPDGADNYRTQFLALPADEAIQHMLTGIGVLAKSELAGERMFTAYDNQDQEDEHSCFSDNTHRDIILNAQGVYNVYTGTYTRTDGTELSGPSLSQLIEAVDSNLNSETMTMLEEARTAVNAIQAPFDQAIVQADSRPQVLEGVNRLQDSGDAIAQAATALDIQINTALPE